MKKLKSRRGETLTETLVSILIIAMAAALLATMVGVSTRLTERARAADEQFYDELSDAERGKGTETKTVTIAVEGGGSQELKISITGGGDALTSYRLGVSP